MNNLGVRLAVVTGVVLLVGFGFTLTRSIVLYPPPGMFDVFKWHWILNDAIVGMIDLAAPLFATAVILTFSLFVARQEFSSRRSGLRFSEIIRPCIVAIVVFAGVYTVTLGTAFPAAARRRDDAVATSRMIRELWRVGRESYARQEYSIAIRDLELFLMFMPPDQEQHEMAVSARSFIDDARRRIELDPAGDTPTEPTRYARNLRNLTAADLVAQASEYMARRDLFSAHYYADLALREDPTNAEAIRIKTRARAGILSPESRPREQLERERFEKKRAAFTALQNGDPITAYYGFRELIDDSPRDPDIERYLDEAVDRIYNDLSFFIDEVDGVVGFPGQTNVVFLASVDPPVFVSAAKIIIAPRGTYLVRVEVMGLAADGLPVYHYSSEYGKLVGDHVFLDAIDRDNPDRRYAPRYHMANARPELDRMVRIPSPSPGFSPHRTMALISAASGDLAAAPIQDLIKMREFLPTVGLAAAPIELELLTRFASPFTLVTFGVFALAVGWSLRARYIARPPIPTILLLPVIPFVLTIVYHAYVHAFRIAATTALVAGGFTVAIVLVVLVAAAALFGGLLAVALSATR